MSVSIRDCLSLPSLSTATIISGRSGIDRIVTSVSVMEFFDYYEIDDVTPNEIIISAFYQIKDDTERQLDALKNLSETGAVALILFYVGQILPRLDEKLTKLSDSLNLPIIVMNTNDYSIKYSDVISDVMSLIIREQSISSNVLSNIEERLSQLPYEQRSMETMLNILSTHFRCNIMIKNSYQNLFQSLYKPSPCPVDWSFIEKSFQGYGTPYSTSHINVGGSSIYLYRKNFVYGDVSPMSIYVSTVNHPLDETEITSISQAIQLFTRLWGYSLDFSNSKTLISLLLKTSPEKFPRLCEFFGVNTNAIHNIVVISAHISERDAIYAKARKIFNDYEKFFLSDVIDENLVILTDLKITEDMDYSLYSDLCNGITQIYNNSSVFIDQIPRAFSHIKKVYKSFIRSKTGLEKIFRNNRVWDFSALNFTNMIMEISDSDSYRKKHLLSITEKLFNEDPSLVDTLAVYMIDCNSKLNIAASKLFLHRNTMSYRLNKAAQITNMDFHIMPTSFEFYSALALFRYSQIKTVASERT